MGCISEESKGGRGCSLSRRRHLLLLRSVLPSLPPSLAHPSISSSPLPPLLLFSPPPLSFIIFLFSVSAATLLYFLSSSLLPLFSPLRFIRSAKEERGDRDTPLEENLSRTRTRASELRTFPVNLAGGRAFVPIQQAR